MPELTINQLIKIIIGALVVVAVIVGVSLFFKNTVISFIKNLGFAGVNETTKLFLGVLNG